MKVTQMPPVHAVNLVANSGNTAYGVDVITKTNVDLWSQIYLGLTWKPMLQEVLMNLTHNLCLEITLLKLL